MHFSLNCSRDCFNLFICLFVLCNILIALPLCVAAPSGRPATDTALAARFLAAHKSTRANAHHGHGHSHGHEHDHNLSSRHSHESSPVAQYSSQYHASPSASRYPRMLDATQAATPRAVLTFQTRGGILDEDWFALGVTELEIVIPDPITSITQSTPGIQCVFTGEQGHMFAVNYGAVVTVSPAQSFIRSNCTRVHAAA